MIIERVQALCELPGVSSHEDAVRKQIIEWVEPYADDIKVDSMGNLLVFRKGLSSDKTALFAAHMDEVGLIVTHITDDGKLQVDAVGGIDDRLLSGKRFWVGERRVLAVGQQCPVHLSGGDKKVTKVTDLVLDIGVSSADEARELVQPGDVVVFDGEPVQYGEGWLKAKALDDRVGCTVLSLLALQQPAVDTWLVFTVQEEVGTRGALTAAHAIQPDYAFVVENTTAADLAEVPAHKVICRPGRGVVLAFMDRGSIYTPPLVRHLQALADRNDIARQTKELIAGGTDAAAIQRSCGGVPTAGLAVAARSIHSAVSAVKTEDIRLMYRLALLAYTTEYDN